MASSWAGRVVLIYDGFGFCWRAKISQLLPLRLNDAMLSEPLSKGAFLYLETLHEFAVFLSLHC